MRKGQDCDRDKRNISVVICEIDTPQRLNGFWWGPCFSFFSFLCCIFALFSFCGLCLMLYISLDCPFLIDASAFSNIYLLHFKEKYHKNVCFIYESKVASLLAATIYQGNHDRNHKLWNIGSLQYLHFRNTK
jgi:hypothetical protein